MSNKDVLNAVLRTDLRLFIHKTFQTLSPGTAYKHNWHIDAIAHHLTLCALGEIKRLVITMPPRHLKSISTSVAFPAWLLGQDPSKRIIGVSYAQDLSLTFSKHARAIMESGWYQACFPGTVLSDATNTQSEFATTKHGFRLATSVAGPLTGRGGDFLIVDDPHKADEAYSPTARAQVIDWFRQTAASRLDDPNTGCIIVIQQRFHQEDLAGTLLADGDWVHLNLPAIAEMPEEIAVGPGRVHHRKPGDVLHPERMSLALLEKTRHDLGSLIFAGQYQQQPATAGGEIVRLSWFKYYREAPKPTHGDRIIQSWDHAYTTAETSNYSVCTTWLCRDGHFFLLDVYRVRLEFPELLRVIPKHAAKWNAGNVVLENVGAGQTLCQELRRLDMHKYKYWTPKDGKATRLMKVSHYIENGRVHLPEAAPWLNPLRQELQYFPNGKYDDQVDSLSQFLNTWPAFERQPYGMVVDKDGDAEAGGSRVTVYSNMPDLSARDLFNLRLP